MGHDGLLFGPETGGLREETGGKEDLEKTVSYY